MKTEMTLPYTCEKANARIKDKIEIPTTCHYCGADVRLINNKEIYGKSYGDWPYAYSCTSCDAYVGVHKDTDVPLGTLANKKTREARKKYKGAFLLALRFNFNGDVSKAYAWLAKEMGIPPEECHWGMFNIERCEKANEVIKGILK